MSAEIGDKGQITLPKDVLEAAGFHAGDRVTFRPRAGGLMVELAEAVADAKPQPETSRRLLEEMAKRKPFQGLSTEETMRLTRGEG
jgi:bifunctional DNA-binding transcriptional regulator/antitoxin component of YhaV-PrlF toxin-antitoxin module